MHWRVIGVVLAVVIMGTAFGGTAYGLWSETLAINGRVATGYTNADFVSASTNDPPGTPDPGYDKDVASCIAAVKDEVTVLVNITNGYPSYTCVFTTTIRNGGTVPERREPLELEVPPELTVTELIDLTGVVLNPGEEDVEAFSVHVEQAARQGFVYTFTIRKPFSLFVSGTIGFWKNWDSHNTYTRAQIEAWLAQIDAASAWLGPTTVGGMEAVFEAANGSQATPQSRFLAHYLATRLDERSGILPALGTHNVTGKDPGNYLGLANPGSASLTEIIVAIEAKYGTSPTNAQFNIMKNVCDALNNLEI